MLKLVTTLIFLTLTAASICGQSGRVKPTETPVPGPVIRPTGIYVPTQTAKTTATPTPTPTPKDDGDVVTVESTLVPIPVSVVDTNGRAVTNLTLNDFELKIDGKVVELSEISRSESPIRLAMLFDNSSSVFIAREFEKDAAIKFFKRVIRPRKDLVALYSVATITRLAQPFTSDVSLLINAIEMFPPPEGATSLLGGIVSASEYMREVSGRRVIVIVSDGDDTMADATLDQAVRALQIANCQVYVVKTTDFENYKRTGSRRGNANLQALAAERRMLEITRQTGGAVHSPLNERELDNAFGQISAELSEQYILSYYPEDGAGYRGQFREITLTLKNRPGLTLRTRKGYYVPKK